ncbi:hypothetical protein EON63_23820, partial [archaeon]
MKNLFRGYPKLILGFNTFLPEGEGKVSMSFVVWSMVYGVCFHTYAAPTPLGYKIELTPEEQCAPRPSYSHPFPAPQSALPSSSDSGAGGSSLGVGGGVGGEPNPTSYPQAAS